MQNLSFLHFSGLSQQIMGSINAWRNLHNASYIKEIKLWVRAWNQFRCHLPRRHTHGKWYQRQFQLRVGLRLWFSGFSGAARQTERTKLCASIHTHTQTHTHAHWLLWEKWSAILLRPSKSFWWGEKNSHGNRKEYTGVGCDCFFFFFIINSTQPEQNKKIHQHTTDVTTAYHKIYRIQSRDREIKHCEHVINSKQTKNKILFSEQTERRGEIKTQ